MSLHDRGPFRRANLKSYISHMSKPNPKAIYDDRVARILAEQGFTWEEEPRSIYDPVQMYTALERFATDYRDFESLDSHLDYGLRMAYKIFAKPKRWKPLKALTDDQVAKQALKLSKSSGLPSLTDKRSDLAYAFDRELQIRQGLKAPNPCIAYTRTSAGNKTRLVWGFPFEMTIMEARFARPLIDQFKKMSTPMAFGMAKVELGARIHRYVVEGKGSEVCLDYSKFDSTIPKVLIKEAFRILGSWFQEDELQELGWQTIIRYFIYTPIVMPDGHLYTGKNHGVPSGSYFTQLIDSVVNVALMYALKHRFEFDFNPRAFYVLGDDVIVNVVGDFDINDWATYIAAIGMKIHPVEDGKTTIGESHFLGAYWDKGKPDVPLEEILSKAVSPETFRDYEGQPDRGSRAVVRSYASNYLSAIQMIPTEPVGHWTHHEMRAWDFPDKFEDEEGKYLTGSDRFMLEERRLTDSHVSRLDLPSILSIRILL